MSNKKKGKNKATKGHNRGGRENSPRGQHTSPLPQRDNSITDQQRSDNGGTGARTYGNKLAVRLIHNPLFSKRGFEHAKEGLKSESSGDSISLLRCFGIFLLVLYPVFLIIYSVVGLSSGDKNNSLHAFVYGSPLFTVTPYCIRCMDDVNTLLLSIFEIGEKSLLEYFADPGIREFLLIIFQIVGLIYQCAKARNEFRIFIWGILGFIGYLLGNTLLILRKRPESVANDLT